MFRWVSTLSMFELTISSWESVRPCGHIHPAGLKTTRQYLHPFNKPRKKAEIKKTLVFTRENQSKNPWGLNFSEVASLKRTAKNPPANEVEGKDRLLKSSIFRAICWFQGGYENQENPKIKPKKKYGMRFQSPHWSRLFFFKTKNLNDVGRQRIAVATLDAAIIALRFWLQAPKNDISTTLFPNGSTVKAVKGWFLSSKLDAFCEAIFFHQNTGSPSTQLPLVVIVGESYPIVGEWVGIVGDPPTGPFHLCPLTECIDTSTVHGHGHWQTYMYIHI